MNLASSLSLHSATSTLALSSLQSTPCLPSLSPHHRVPRENPQRPPPCPTDWHRRTFVVRAAKGFETKKANQKPPQKQKPKPKPQKQGQGGSKSAPRQSQANQRTVNGKQERPTWTQDDSSAASASPSEIPFTAPKLRSNSLPTFDIERRLDFSQEVVEEAWNQTLVELSQNMTVEGYPPGARIPEYVLVPHVGERTVKKLVLQRIMDECIPSFLEEAGKEGRVVEKSQVGIADTEDDVLSRLSPFTPLEFTVRVPVVPLVKWKSERVYANLQVEVPVSTQDLLPLEMTAHIRALALSHYLAPIRASPSPVVRPGDVAIVDMRVFRINEDWTKGELVHTALGDAVTAQEKETPGHSAFPELKTLVVGMKRGECKVVDLVLAPWWREKGECAEDTARVQLVCCEILERDIPDLDDMNPDLLHPGSTSLEEAMEALKEGMQLEREERMNSDRALALVDEVLRACEVDIPDSILEEEAYKQFQRVKGVMKRDGFKFSEEDEISTNREAVTSWVRTNKSACRHSLACDLALRDVFRREGLSCNGEILKTHVSTCIKRLEAEGQEYDREEVEAQAQWELEGLHALAWVRHHADFIPVLQRPKI